MSTREQWLLFALYMTLAAYWVHSGVTADEHYTIFFSGFNVALFLFAGITRIITHYQGRKLKAELLQNEQILEALRVSEARARRRRVEGRVPERPS